MLSKATKYIGEVRREMKKVMWPTRLELRDSAVIVVVLSLILAIFVFATDLVLNNLLKIVF